MLQAVQIYLYSLRHGNQYQWDTREGSYLLVSAFCEIAKKQIVTAPYGDKKEVCMYDYGV